MSASNTPPDDYPVHAETRDVGPCNMQGEVVGSGVLCTFESGEVDGLLVGDRHEGGSFVWDCPVCGAENDTNVDGDSSDPDAERDL